MDLDLACVASFLVLLEEKHYGRAAERLHLSAPGLTKRVQRLEQQVGVPLLVRDNAGVVGPTAAGSRFARDALPLLASATAARRAARNAATSRVLRLGVPGTIGDFPSLAELEQVRRAMTRRHPDVKLLCGGVAFSALTTALLDHDVDVVWTAAEVQHPAVLSTPLVDVQRVGVVGPRHELADAAEVRAADFAGLTMVYDPSVADEWMSLWWLGDVRPAREAQLVSLRATNLASVVRHLTSTTHVTVIHQPLARRIPRPLHTVPLLGAPAITYCAARRRDDERASVRGLVDVMQDAAQRMVGRQPGTAVPEQRRHEQQFASFGKRGRDGQLANG